MKQIELTSKLGLVVIAITAISVAIGIQAYNIQAADAQAKLPNNSVTSATIVNGQVKAEDIAAGVIPGALPNVHRVFGQNIVVQPGQYAVFKADCPNGEVVTGGGLNGGSRWQMSSSFPEDENTWTVNAANLEADERGNNAIAICMGPAS